MPKVRDCVSSCLDVTVRRLRVAEIRYFDTITVKHKDTKQFLHSHDEAYPLRYDDGRISSQGELNRLQSLRHARYRHKLIEQANR